MKRDYRSNLKTLITYPSIWEKIVFIMLLILIFGNFLCGMDTVKQPKITEDNQIISTSINHAPLFYTPLMGEMDELAFYRNSTHLKNK